jgi:hypothetical protein
MNSFLKKIIFNFTSLIIIISVCEAQNTNILWVLEELKVNAPIEYSVISEYGNLPQSFSVKLANGEMSSYKTFQLNKFLTSTDKTGLLSDINTEVHEVNHGLTNAKAYTECKRRGLNGKKYIYYYFTPSGNEFLIRSDLNFFPLRKISPKISTELKTFRFDTYVEGNSSTQNNGLLGLLGEFNAYSHSMATSYYLKKSYMSLSSSELRNYIDWRSAMSSYVQSYYEFKYFLLQYLLFAKENEFILYDDIKNDIELSKAISVINNDFLKLIDLYNLEDLKIGPAYWKSKGYTFEKNTSEGFDYYKIGGSRIGYGNAMVDIKKLLPEINSSQFNEVKKDFLIN